MAIPPENYVVRLLAAQPYLVATKVHDLVIAGAGDAVMLVSWGYSPTPIPNIQLTGYSVLRFDPLGKLKWEYSRTICQSYATECGLWEFSGALARTPNGFIVAGTATRMGSTATPTAMFATRITDAGTHVWSRSYKPSPPPTPDFYGITSIAPMTLSDHYLIAANSGADAFLWIIDGGGMPITAGIANFMFIRRLRATPSQGIFALGEFAGRGDGWTLPAIICMDPASFKINWWRWYSTTVEGPLYAPRWLDIAEGDQSLLVVGNRISNLANELEPHMAFLDLGSTPPGDVRQAMAPKHGTQPVHLRNVASFIEDVIPLSPTGRRAHFAVTGEVDQQPWQFAMNEDGSVAWQKRYRTPSSATGTLGPIAFPQYENIVAAGSYNAGSSESHPFLTSSRLTIPTTTGETSRCATEADVSFPDQYLFSRPVTERLDSLVIVAGELYEDEGRMMKAMPGCLDAPIQK